MYVLCCKVQAYTLPTLEKTAGNRNKEIKKRQPQPEDGCVKTCKNPEGKRAGKLPLHRSIPTISIPLVQRGAFVKMGGRQPRIVFGTVACPSYEESPAAPPGVGVDYPVDEILLHSILRDHRPRLSMATQREQCIVICDEQFQLRNVEYRENI